MPDRVDRGFDGLRRAATPDLWDGIETRAPSPAPSEPGPLRRAAIAVVALCVAAAGLGVAYAAFRDDGATVATPPGVVAGSGRIAFTASEPREEDSDTGLVSGSSGAERPGPPPQVYTVNPDGSDRQQLTDDPTLKGSLVWSPDGSMLAFTGYDLERDVEQLSVMAADGSDRRIVCEGCTGTFSVYPDGTDCFESCGPMLPSPSPNRLSWSPDGVSIAAPRTQDGGLALIDVASGEVREIDLGRVGGTSWSPDGTRLAVGVTGRDPGLFVVDPGAGAASRLLAADPYSGGLPAWSPDASTIAFAQATKVGGDLHAGLLFVDPRDGSSRTVLGTDVLSELYDLEWSPDGGRVAVLHHPVDPPTAGLLTIAADGSDVRMLALCENGRDADGLCSSNGGDVSWSSDGRSLAFLNDDGSGDAFTVLTIGGEAVPVSGALVPGCCLAWSSAAGPEGTGVPPEPTQVDVEGWLSYEDPDHGFSVHYPAGWTRSDRSLTPQLVDPAEILSVGTFPMRPGGPNCVQFPVNAITDLGPGDALISILERERGDVGAYPPRPEAFGPQYGSDGDESRHCLDAPKEFSHWWIAFSDQGRAFYAYVAMGSEVTDQRRDEAWAILDSLRFSAE